MRSYQIKRDINLDALENYLKNSYPVEIISSAKNILELKIFSFYRFLPIPPFIFEDAIVSIRKDQNTGFTTVRFSIFSNYFIALFLASLFFSFAFAIGCGPEGYFELFLFFIIIFPLLFLPGFLWSWFKHERLISILSKE